MKVCRILLIGALFVIYRPLWAQEALDRIIAIVGDNVILQSELFQYSYSLAAQLGIDLQREPDKVEELRRETLNNLITQKVLLEKAKEDSVTISEKQVEALLEEQINQMIQQLGTQEKVEEYFGMPVRRMRREFRKDVEERLLVEKLQNLKAQEIQISRREVEEFYRTHRDSLPEMQATVNISHILFKIEASGLAAQIARTKIEEIKRRIDNGEDFQELAKQYSQDPGSAPRGGDLGTMKRGDTVKPFEEAAYALEPGQISDIVQSEFGFHIIKLIKKTGMKIHAQHILIRLDSSDEDASFTEAKLKKLKEKIERGDLTFEEAAQKLSQDDQTAANGGDLGSFQVDQFQIEAFRSAIVGLKEGEISEPVRTKFGYHLIKVNSRSGARRLSIQDDWEQIENWALNMKRQEEFKKWVQEIKKNVYIDIKG